MRFISPLVFLLPLLLFQFLRTSSGFTIPQKSGKCPDIKAIDGVCVSNCENDFSCNGTMKCCPSGCDDVWKICVRPEGSNGTSPRQTVLGTIGYHVTLFPNHTTRKRRTKRLTRRPTSNKN